jgi:cyclopropane-fatty-acyl-phospholipid synthase
MQAIVINDEAFNRAKRTTDFIKDQIFPGGCLPSIAALRRDAHAQGLLLETVEDYGPSYARTLAEWRANLHASDLVDRRFQRLWEFYFAYCQTGFEEGYISVAQLRFVHAQP